MDAETMITYQDLQREQKARDRHKDYWPELLPGQKNGMSGTIVNPDGYSVWKQEVDRIVSTHLDGLTTDDFSDANWKEYWENWASPLEAIAAAGDDGCDEAVEFLRLFPGYEAA